MDLKKRQTFSTLLMTVMVSSGLANALINNTNVHIVTVIEEFDKTVSKLIDETLSEVETQVKTENLDVSLNFTHHTIWFKEGDEFQAYLQLCDYLLNGISLLLDLTWEGWIHAQSISTTLNLPYVHLDITIKPFVQASDDFLRYRNATDAALVFLGEKDLDQSLLYLIGNTVIRIVVVDATKPQATDNLRVMKPVPSQFVAYGTGEQLQILFGKLNVSKLLARDTIWTVVQMDFENISLSGFPTGVAHIKPTINMCCSVIGDDRLSKYGAANNTEITTCNCENHAVKDLFISTAIIALGQVFRNMYEEFEGIVLTMTNCSNYTASADFKAAEDEDTINDQEQFIEIADKTISDMEFVDFNDTKIKWNLALDVMMTNSSGTHNIGKWTSETRFVNLAGDSDELVKRFFRVGTVVQLPFVYEKRGRNGEQLTDEYSNPLYSGFCMDLLERLSKEMKFNYQLIIKPPGAFGRKVDGQWDGLVEREEAIDFVAPYFEQSGISIIMRKPEKTTSLFKFMSVLKDEVWWCILAALVVTAIVLWVVDRYSPYSGRNKELYPYKCREFTLSECFWFALTSMTPQGGGEPPKAVSGRILVASYWIFVVLMLATFTANLAAFLTVERMQSPVNSMEELAKQSKINYSVVEGSTIHEYFLNMASAEEQLYNVWKDMTLNSTSDQAKYRVWDYPIKEQYSRILSVITGSGVFKTVEEGYEKINNDLDRKFAFIHDASTLRYAVYHNCNFTEVGEPFAEQPYAIAVQSGSHLQDEIGKHLLELQKDRYFEMLSQKYWNASLKKQCPDSEESEGITLASIGGVFIATLVGLAIGMITLVGEIFYYKKQKKSKVVAISVKPKKGMEQ
ncbi:hypothetical protein CHUAL_008778 [Chamberlinius hualienensis]